MHCEYCVLFISRRNLTRSLTAEAVVSRHGKRAFSAGVGPAAEVEMTTIEALDQDGYSTAEWLSSQTR
jgi:protein-tyrosine-phosphatase